MLGSSPCRKPWPLYRINILSFVIAQHYFKRSFGDCFGTPGVKRRTDRKSSRTIHLLRGKSHNQIKAEPDAIIFNYTCWFTARLFKIIFVYWREDLLLAKRIVPCLDVKDGRVVKGVQFVDLRDAGDPVELARFYDSSGADELVFLDITASYEKRETMVDVARRTAREVFIPFIVGGGIDNLEHIRAILKAGADKISLNTSAVKTPQLIREGAHTFGSQCIVVAIDACWNEELDDWEVYTHGGRTPTGMLALKWAEEVESLGAGEILLTSMNADGGQDGFDLPLNRAVAERVNIPVIASGGAGKIEHFAQVLTEGKADAALAASVFHFRQFSVMEVKNYLQQQGVEVRMTHEQG